MKYLKRYNATQYISRLLAAFSFVLLITFATSSPVFYDKAFYARINFPIFLLSIVGLFALLYFVQWDKLINCITLLNLTAYFTLAANDAMDYWFSFGMCLVLCMAVYYLDFGSIPFRMPKWTMWTIVGAMALVYAILLGITCCWYYWDYWDATYDFGIFSQMFHYMKETGQMLTTCERDMLLSHFDVHFSPIYYLLLPVYGLFPTQETLLFSCAAVVALGVIPLVLLCRKYALSPYCCIAFSAVYLLYPGFIGGQFYPIHENCFLVALLLWFFYFVEKDKTLPACIFALLTMTVKEDAPVYIAVASIYFIFANKSRIMNTFILMFSLTYFISVTEFMRMYGEGVMDDMRYGDYIYDDGGLLTVVKSLIQNPVFAIKQIFKTNKILYVVQMLAPLCFLPFIIKKPAKLILLIPFILINLMSNYPYQADIGFQYHFGTGAFLFYLAVTNYAELGEKRSKAIVCALLCSVIIFTGGLHGRFRFYESYKLNTSTRETIDQALDLIPEDASVSASTFFVAKLSQRDIVYDLGYTDKETEYVAVDLRVAGPEDPNKFFSQDYEVLYHAEGIVAVFRNLNYKPAS